MFKSIGNKINLVVGTVVALALIGVMAFYITSQRDNIMAQNERTMNKLTESVIEGLQTIMISGYADVAEVFAERLLNVKDVDDFRLLRPNGLEAFKDNKTIENVNQRRGEEEFVPREKESTFRVLESNNPDLLKSLNNKAITFYYSDGKKGERLLTFLAPIINEKECHKCHGSKQPIRGVLKLTTSMAQVEADIRESMVKAVIVMVGALIGILMLTWLMIRHAVVRPIDRMTDAMTKVSKGNMSQQVPVVGKDELSVMATNFNQMSDELQQTYSGLEMEQGKLTTIIHSANEGIVVTDSDGKIVLTNPAATQLLQKNHDAIVESGFINLLDDPMTILNQVSQSEQDAKPITIEFNNRILNISARTILSPEGGRVGSAALLRDITEEKQLENQLRELSTTDALTKLFNRRHLDITLAKELTRAHRYELNLAIMMFDVDHFKRFNDDHGHDQGDRVLQTLGAVMKESCRDVDVPCRYGGEEFLIILPNTAEEGAMILAERLRAKVEATEVDGLHVTISIGVAVFPRVKVDKYDAFIEAADKALYKGKEAGRNIVCLAD